MGFSDKSKKRKNPDSSDGLSKRPKVPSSASSVVSARTSLTRSLSSRNVRPAKKSRKKAAEFFDDPGSSDDEFIMSKALPDTSSDAEEEEEEKPAPKPKADSRLPAETTKLKPALVSREDKKEKKTKKEADDKTVKKKSSVTFEEPKPAQVEAGNKKKADTKAVSKSADKAETKAKPVEKSESKSVTKKTKTKAQPVKEPTPEPEVSDEEEEADADADTTADDIFAGFSDSDEENDNEVQIAIADIPKVPQTKEIAKLKKKQKEANGSSDEPGTICVSSIPHGFYEPQMKAYFSQFGDINRLRLSRNRKTGHSKHYAFIEFASAEVADIVAKTMNNYLLFNHRLKVEVKAPESLHKDLWKGAGRRFKVVPRAQIMRRKLEAGATKEQWDETIRREKLRRKKKLAAAKKLGYSFKSPKIKSLDGVTARLVVPAPESKEASSKSKAKSKVKVNTLKAVTAA